MAHVPPTSIEGLDLSSLIERISELEKKQKLIRQAEQTLSSGRFLDEDQEKAYRSKSSVEHQLELLEMFMKETSLDQAPLNASVDKPVEEASLKASESAGKCKDDEEEGKPRCVYVTDGLVICCLELKHGNREFKDADSIPSLPKVSTLKVLKGGRRLVSAGLFKWGSEAYVIGGQLFPENPCASDVKAVGLRPWGPDLYRFLFAKYHLKGLSRSIQRLTVDGNGNLSLRGCDFPKLEDPKVWPIVEVIGGVIHVISSRPRMFPIHGSCSRGSNHEFLNLTTKAWSKIPDIAGIEIGGISSHLVVGTRIYATGLDGFLMFDSNTQKWQGIKRGNFIDHPLYIKQVWQFLEWGYGRCAGEFQLPLPPGGGGGDSLFVVIAVVSDIGEDDDSAQMVAYLVTSTGDILCVQCLPHFFWKEMRPLYTKVGTMVNVAEQLMCVVVNRNAVCDFGDFNMLFINTFTVEVLIAESSSRVAEIRKETSQSSYPVELEFVRVHVKDRYVYKLDDYKSDDSDLVYFNFLQACFP